MQMVDISKCIEGIFVKELKNRFLCEVLVSGVSTICYVPSSCHLGNFLTLQGKKVLLAPTSTPNARTSYSLYAIPYKRSYIVLNTSMANRVVEASLQRRQFSFLGKRTHVLAEYRIDNYKADLYIEDTDTIIEVKSVLSLDEVAKFPTVFSERALTQLAKLKEFLAYGYNVHYCIVSLNPYVKSIQILNSTTFQSLLQDCLSNGMTISGHSCRIRDGRAQLDNMLPISSAGNESPQDCSSSHDTA